MLFKDKFLISPKSQVPSLSGSKAQISSFKSQIPTVQVHWVLPLYAISTSERSLRFLVPSSKFQVPNSGNGRARGNLQNHESQSFFRSFFHQEINIKRKRSAYFSQS